AAAVAVNGNTVTYTSPAAEIAYFLDTTRPIDIGAGVFTYNLIRRQRLVAMTDTERFNLTPPAPNAPDPGVVSVSLMTGQVNSLADLTNPNNRLCGPGRRPNGALLATPAPNGGVVTTTAQSPGSGPAPYVDGYLAALSGGRFGDDVLLSGVISF